MVRWNQKKFRYFFIGKFRPQFLLRAGNFNEESLTQGFEKRPIYKIILRKIR